MNEISSQQTTHPSDDSIVQSRRDLLRSLGKWSGAAITAALFGPFVATPEAQAGSWVNRRYGGRSGWVNRRYGGGSAWVNRSGGGGGAWVNRRYGGGGAWVNRRYGGGGAWVNRW